MNSRDKRSVGEQVLSGLRITGWFLFSFAIAIFLIRCTMLALNRPPGAGIMLRILGVCTLMAVSILLYFTTQYWAKWFFGVIAVRFLRVLFLPLVVPLTAALIQFMFLYLIAVLLSWRFALRRSPTDFEKIAMVGMVISICFSLILEAPWPFWIGAVALAAAEFAAAMFKNQRRMAATMR